VKDEKSEAEIKNFVVDHMPYTTISDFFFKFYLKIMDFFTILNAR
jgi:hypothetical protein